MASVLKDVIVDAPASHCWAALRDFGALHERLAKGFITNTTMVGEREREVTFANGAVARELLVGVDEGSMRLAYTVVAGPLQSSHHNASAQIVPVGADRCRFVWITDVLPDDLGGRMSAVMDAGVQAMKATLEATARSSAGMAAADSQLADRQSRSVSDRELRDLHDHQDGRDGEVHLQCADAQPAAH